jgi:hypothetical protein
MWVAATLHPDLREDLAALSCLALHADYLAQRVYDIYQIPLHFHYGVDGLVRHRRFVDYVRILAALDAGRRLRVIVHGGSRWIRTIRDGFMRAAFFLLN